MDCGPLGRIRKVIAMSKRKVIQIESLNETDDCLGMTTALCDDGTIWRKYWQKDENTEQPWEQQSLPPGCEPDDSDEVWHLFKDLSLPAPVDGERRCVMISNGVYGHKVLLSVSLRMTWAQDPHGHLTEAHFSNYDRWRWVNPAVIG